jgi:hypothetical protein
VYPSARANWCQFLNVSPRSKLSELSVYDISDGGERLNPFNPERERIWPDEDGVNILGTRLESKHFVSSCMHEKGLKHRLVFQFIKDVAAAGFPREDEKMRNGAIVPRQSHILRSVK